MCLFFFFGLWALVESFSRKYLILAVTDNVVRPPDGFYATITSISLSVALWIIQDYVVIPLILIALRFQWKYGNSKVALRSNEFLSRRPDGAATFISSLFVFIPSLSAVSINPAANKVFGFSKQQWCKSSSDTVGKTCIYSTVSRRGEDEVTSPSTRLQSSDALHWPRLSSLDLHQTRLAAAPSLCLWKSLSRVVGGSAVFPLSSPWCLLHMLRFTVKQTALCSH